jgi:hypothetical protein
MARLVTSGGEVRDHPTADINGPDGITAGATATTTDTTNQRSGLACLACAGTAANTSFRQWAFTAPALGAQVYGRVYFQVDALPTSSEGRVVHDRSGGTRSCPLAEHHGHAPAVERRRGGADRRRRATTVARQASGTCVQLRLLINTGAVDQAEMLRSPTISPAVAGRVDQRGRR